MTLNELVKQSQVLQAAGYGRAKVTVDRNSLNHGNGCWQICDIQSVDCERVTQSDGDGSSIFNRDGSERSRLCVVLSGESKRKARR